MKKMRATLPLALAALLLAAPTARAQFADQRTFATTSTGSANAQAVAIARFNTTARRG